MSCYIDGYLIDAAVTEGHTFSSEVTQYPVESGSDITDNVRQKPDMVTIEGIVSDNPIGSVALIRNRTRVNDPSLSTTNLQNPDTSGDFLPSDECLAKLLAIQAAGQPITIETSLKRYDSMVMSNLEIPRDASTGAALHFTAQFQLVRIVTNNRINIRVASPNMAGKKSNVIKSTKGFEIVNQPTVTTLSGKTAIFDPARGSYVYGSSLPGGNIVPDTDMPGGQNIGPNSLVPATGGTPQRPYFDYGSQKWLNPDGSSATRQQIDDSHAEVPALLVPTLPGFGQE